MNKSRCTDFFLLISCRSSLLFLICCCYIICYSEEKSFFDYTNEGAIFYPYYDPAENKWGIKLGIWENDILKEIKTVREAFSPTPIIVAAPFYYTDGDVPSFFQVTCSQPLLSGSRIHRFDPVSGYLIFRHHDVIDGTSFGIKNLLSGATYNDIWTVYYGDSGSFIAIPNIDDDDTEEQYYFFSREHLIGHCVESSNAIGQWLSAYREKGAAIRPWSSFNLLLVELNDISDSHDRSLVVDMDGNVLRRAYSISNVDRGVFIYKESSNTDWCIHLQYSNRSIALTNSQSLENHSYRPRIKTSKNGKFILVNNSAAFSLDGRRIHISPRFSVIDLLDNFILAIDSESGVYSLLGVNDQGDEFQVVGVFLEMNVEYLPLLAGQFGGLLVFFHRTGIQHGCYVWAWSSDGSPLLIESVRSATLPVPSETP